MFQKEILMQVSAVFLLLAAGSEAFAADTVRSVTAITEVFGDGQKVSAVAVEYGAVVDNAKLKATDFAVEGGTVSKVYSNTSAAEASQGTNGAFVIIELANTIQAAVMGPPPDGSNSGSNSGPPAGGGPSLGQLAEAAPAPAPLTAQVTQKGTVTTTSGQRYQPGGTWKSTRTANLVVEDFRQAVYIDPQYPTQPLMYNLFIPKNYDPAKKYPLVLFMHDAGVVSLNPTQTLTQGQGAVAFASPAAQTKNEAFVLAPQYDRVIADDNSKATDQLDITVDLLKSLTTQYSIDTDRLYNTGQSMGGMITIAMDIKYPNLFAASLLVACQWDPAQAAPMAKLPLWIVVSEGDSKAKPGEEAIMEVLKPLGATVSAATWSAEAPASEIEKNVAALAAANTSIHYTVYRGGNHRYTWQYSYGTDGIREWLFTQARTAGYTAAELSARAEALSRAGDSVGAIPFFLRAASLGEAHANEMLGEVYASGRGAEVDFVKAVAYDQAAANLGSTRALTNLGILYQHGNGVTQSWTKALKLFEQAAAAGDMKGPRWAGILYLNGAAGIPADPTKASAFFTQAANRGDVTANYYLGCLYESGIVVVKDYSKAADYYAKAAPATGHAEGAACFALGRLYENGLGVVRDRAKAVEWYERGATLDDADSKAALNRLTTK